MLTSTYTITHACGHTADRKVRGVVQNDLERQADYWEHCVCPDCYRAKQDRQSAKSDLPQLVGTQKQVEWATTLRAQIIRRVDAYIVSFSKSHPDRMDIIAQMQQDRTRMLAHSEATFWITNRNHLDALENA